MDNIQYKKNGVRLCFVNDTHLVRLKFWNSSNGEALLLFDTCSVWITWILGLQWSAWKRQHSQCSRSHWFPFNGTAAGRNKLKLDSRRRSNHVWNRTCPIDRSVGGKKKYSSNMEAYDGVSQGGSVRVQSGSALDFNASGPAYASSAGSELIITAAWASVEIPNMQGQAGLHLTVCMSKPGAETLNLCT